MPSWDIIVRGRVQGVGYRRTVIKCAKACGITGFVENLVDGSVGIMAQGDELRFETFCQMIRTGNRFIKIADMYIKKLEPGEEEEILEYETFELH